MILFQYPNWNKVALGATGVLVSKKCLIKLYVQIIDKTLNFKVEQLGGVDTVKQPLEEITSRFQMIKLSQHKFEVLKGCLGNKEMYKGVDYHKSSPNI